CRTLTFAGKNVISFDKISAAGALSAARKNRRIASRAKSSLCFAEGLIIVGSLMTNFRPKLLGIAATLRTARWEPGNRYLIDALMTIPDRPALDAFLTRESELHLENFVQAGRRDKKPFVEIYRNLRKSNGEVGLSNSEVALAAALWSARQEGTEVAHL